MDKVTLSNAGVYLAIAEEALAESQRLLGLGCQPKGDGVPGMVKAYDPEQRSFKQALIAIVFAAAYFEAILRIVGRDRLGRQEYDRVEVGTTYEQKLEDLGISDAVLLQMCKQLRETRNDLLHERQLEPEADADGRSRRVSGETAFRFAQGEAVSAVTAAKKIATRLMELPRGTTPPRHTLTDAELLSYSAEHVAYEFQMFLGLAKVRATGPVPSAPSAAESQLLNNATIEAFVVHLRNVIDFLYPRRSGKKDVTAESFLAPGDWQRLRPPMSDTLQAARKRADKEMAHLTAGRIAGLPLHKGWDVDALAEEVRPILVLFAANAPAGRLSPKVPEILA